MIPSTDELLDLHLQRFCTECGKEFPAPGEPCGCGGMPAVTRAEAAERLATPAARAQMAAAALRQQVQARLDANAADLRRADMIEHVARLEGVRDEAAAKVPPLLAEASRLAGELEKAQGREQSAAKDEADSRGNFRRAAKARERADRTRASAAVRTEAVTRANSAAIVLEADQATLRAAAAERQRAASALAVASARVEAAQATVRAAEDALASPGRAPKSLLTLTLDLTRQAVGGDLEPVEQAFVRALGMVLAQATGAAEDIMAKAAKQAREAEEQRVRDMPAFLRRLPDGNYATEANPFNPATPRPGGATVVPRLGGTVAPGITVRPGIG